MPDWVKAFGSWFKPLATKGVTLVAGWRWWAWVFLFAFLAGGVSGCWLRGCVSDVFTDGAPVGSMGWVDDPDAVDAVMATMVNPVFADAAAALVAEEKDALLYRAAFDATGKVLSPHNQGGVGSC